MDDYKREEKRSEMRAEDYERDEVEWKKSKGSTNYLPPHVRNTGLCEPE